MRKGSVITLVLGIVLVVLGILMVAGGAAIDAPHSAVYNYGHGFMLYSMRYSYSMQGYGNAFVSFGHLVFDGGLALMVIFTVLQVADHMKEKDKKNAEKKENDDLSSMKKAKAEAVDATVHEVDEEDNR